MLGKHAIKKYVVCPGYVTSRKDNQRHFVTARALVDLYGVALNECVTYDYEQASSSMSYERDNEWKLKLIALHPRSDGNYLLPGESKAEEVRRKVVWPFPIVVGNIP